MAFFTVRIRWVILIITFAVAAVGCSAYYFCRKSVYERERVRQEAEYKSEVLPPPVEKKPEPEKEKKEYIKWVEFDVSRTALEQAIKYDISSYGDENHLTTVQVLSYLGAKYGGDFNHYNRRHLTELLAKISDGQSFDEIVADMKYYKYYSEAYGAVAEEFVGEYEQDGEKKYGLKVFSPIGGGYGYSHFSDFGVQRSYGYKRRHLGHDMMGNVGTPVIAIESGYIEQLGWNQYGGWRIGIRSFNNRRYYYYAHLRKNHPYARDFKEGDIVCAGDVIGYMGMTGYSAKENVNNINTPHLHLGMQLIFDESQKDGVNQIWIDMYDIVNLLEKNKSYVQKNGNEFVRKSKFSEPIVSKYLKGE